MKIIFLILQFIMFGCAHTNPEIQPQRCDSNPKLQIEKSSELIRLAEEDQADRSASVEKMDWNKINPRDLQRRIQVATIFAEGCFKTAADYASAAIVYQHGNTPDHFYQAFIWANQAIKLGEKSQMWLAAASLDRYLVNSGQKQLFGTQINKNNDSNLWCIHAVEPSFPESLRIKYVKYSLKQQVTRMLKAIGTSQSPDDIKDCDSNLKASPQGTVNGFW